MFPGVPRNGGGAASVSERVANEAGIRTMAERRLDHNFFERMKCEHRELFGLMDHIRFRLSATEQDNQWLSSSIARLCDLVESHFLCEEQGGYLHEAIHAAPHLTDKAEHLHGQHQVLLEEVRSLRDFAVKGMEGTMDTWCQAFRSRFDAFVEKLHVHEAHEDDLVQQAFTQELGPGD
jgi:hypothetical protein